MKLRLLMVGLVGAAILMSGCASTGGAKVAAPVKPMTLEEFMAQKDQGTAEEKYDRLVSFLAWPRNQFFSAQADLYEAIGNKQLADLYKSQAEAVLSGTSDAEAVAAQTEAAQKNAEESLASSEPLSEEAKAQYKAGMKKMGQALLAEGAVIGVTVALGVETADQVNKLKDEMQDANPLQSAKLAKRLTKVTAAATGTAYLAKQIPGDLKTGYDTYKMSREFGKKNGIESEDIDVNQFL